MDDRPGTPGRFAIDFRFQKVTELFVGERRPLHVGRRHHAGAKLPHDFFPQLGMIPGGGDVNLRE